MPVSSSIETIFPRIAKVANADPDVTEVVMTSSNRWGRPAIEITFAPGNSVAIMEGHNPHGVDFKWQPCDRDGGIAPMEITTISAIGSHEIACAIAASNILGQ